MKKKNDEPTISPRETEVLDGLQRGKSQEHIGEQLGITANTVRTHSYNAQKKLSAVSITNAIAIAIHKKLLVSFL